MDIINTPSKNFSLNNIKKLIEKHKGTEKCLVIDKEDWNTILNFTSNGFNVEDKVLKNGIVYK